VPLSVRACRLNLCSRLAPGIRGGCRRGTHGDALRPLGARGRDLVGIEGVILGILAICASTALGVDPGQDAASQCGNHHIFELPRCITAGKMTMRAMKASITIATAMPSPNSFTAVPGWKMYEANTKIMISAAAMTIRLPSACPRLVASLASPCNAYSSCIRETR